MSRKVDCFFYKKYTPYHLKLLYFDNKHNIILFYSAWQLVEYCAGVYKCHAGCLYLF